MKQGTLFEKPRCRDWTTSQSIIKKGGGPGNQYYTKSGKEVNGHFTITSGVKT